MKDAYAIVLILVFGALAIGGSLYWDRFVRQFEEETERVTYEQSRTHVEGAIDDLYRYRLKYYNADNQAHRNSLRAMILRRARDVDGEDMPRDIRTFVDSLRQTARP